MNNPDRSRPMRLAPFALAFVCLLLPFVQVSCQHKPIASVSGMQLVTGSEIEQPDAYTGQIRTQRADGLLEFQLAVACMLGGAVVGMLPSIFGKLCSALLGLGGIVASWTGKGAFERLVHEKGKGLFTVEWQTGYFAMLACLLIGAVVAGIQAAQASQPRQKSDTR